MKPEFFDIAVIGAGPAGLMAGLACAKSGLRTAVIGPGPRGPDRRTSALFGGSIELLKRLTDWRSLAGRSVPVSGIRIVDGGGGMLRAPEVLFRAAEAGVDAFGYNIPNAVLVDALEAAAAPCLTRFDTGAAGVDIQNDGVVLSLEGGVAIEARLVVAADGRASSTRSAAGIDVADWKYPQSVVVATFDHKREHHNISTELHRAVGPLTVVPGPGRSSNLVWIDTHEEVARLMALGDEAFVDALATGLKGLLGKPSGISPRQSFRLSGQTAKRFAKNRVIVVGEAAHVIPPIGAQGLNLSFRDAATVAEFASESKRAGEDIGGEAMLGRYDKARRADVGTRVFAVDALNRSLMSTIPGVSLARGLGLFALASSPALRARVMREGITPFASSPALMTPANATTEI